LPSLFASSFCSECPLPPLFPLSIAASSLFELAVGPQPSPIAPPANIYSSESQSSIPFLSRLFDNWYVILIQLMRALDPRPCRCVVDVFAR
jgi:hypothetical protein